MLLRQDSWKIGHLVVLWTNGAGTVGYPHAKECSSTPISHIQKFIQNEPLTSYKSYNYQTQKKTQK